MKNITFSILNNIFSAARINQYLNLDDSAETVLKKYHYNVALSAAMLPVLHYLEMCLRNRINYILQKYYGNEWLINYPDNLYLSVQDLQKIKDIIHRLKRENGRNPKHDDVVAQMTFGFWAAFFHRRYDPIIWHRKDALKTVFPNLCRENRKRSYVEERILSVKKIRNRIAHHERIWQYRISICTIHDTCMELIQAMSQEAVEMLKSIDQFQLIYKKCS